MRLTKTLSLVVVLALANTACGDDDDEAAVSKADFVKQANVVCGKHQAEFEALFETDFPTSQEKIPAFFAKATPIVKRQNAELKSLDRPEDDEALDEIYALADKVEADFEKAERGAKFGAELFGEEGGENSRKLDEKLEAYGLTNCVEGEDEEAAKLDPSTFSPEKQAFVQKGDELCKSFDEKSDELDGQYLATFPPPREAWAEFLPRISAAFKEHLAAFKKLTPPPGDEATIADLIAKQDALLPKIDEAHRAYGFQVCGASDDDDDGGGE